MNLVFDQGSLGDVTEMVLVVPMAIGATTLGVREVVVRFELVDTGLPAEWDAVEFQSVVDQASRCEFAGLWCQDFEMKPRGSDAFEIVDVREEREDFVTRERDHLAAF